MRYRSLVGFAEVFKGWFAVWVLALRQLVTEKSLHPVVGDACSFETRLVELSETMRPDLAPFAWMLLRFDNAGFHGCA